MQELLRQVNPEGPEDAKILILSDVPGWDDLSTQRPLTNYAGKILFDQFRKAGVMRSDCRIELISQQLPPNRKFYKFDPWLQDQWRADCLKRIMEFRPNVLVPLGEEALRLVTSESQISKWHLSIIQTSWGIKCIPLFHPDIVLKTFSDMPFLTFGAQRIAIESRFPEIKSTERNFILRPTEDQIRDFISRTRKSESMAVDIETGAGQITCIGFAPSPTEAICIPTLPRDWPNEETFFRVWKLIAKILENSSVPKIFQNNPYDLSYLSLYGIRVLGPIFDTMHAMKFLHPELPRGLDTIARLYTREPYWKDEAKDWGINQNPDQLYQYNCKDCVITWEAAQGLKLDLEKRNLSQTYQRLVGDLEAPGLEMSHRGLPINQETRAEIRKSVESKIQSLTKELQTEIQPFKLESFNPKSHVQVKGLLRAAGMRIPIKQKKESSDILSLMKLRLKHPGAKFLSLLIKISKLNKQISSYLNAELEPDGKLRSSFDICATETGRWTARKNAFYRGLNAQTIPGSMKPMIEAPPGFRLLEIDLKQADARFVAWDSGDQSLIQMYQDGIDIHRWVAGLVFSCPIEAVTKDQRDLGKRIGHGSNYDMQAPTFQMTCLKEMDLVLSEGEARRMLESYHQAFPGIRKWHERLQDQIRKTKTMTTPMGRERVFYGRIGPDLFKELYAYRPQSTVLDVINCLVKHLNGKVPLLAQVHDSTLVMTHERNLTNAIQTIKDQDAWNPVLKLRGGDLRIPIEIKTGRTWGEMEEVFSG